MSGQTPNPKPQIPTGTMGTEPVGHGEHRLGVVALFVENRLAAAPKVNAVLSDHAAIVVGRMGIPYREKDLSVVAIIVDGTNDEIGAMTGKLGTIPGVSVKAALRKKNGADKLENRNSNDETVGER